MKHNHRYISRIVSIGTLKLGGSEPVRIQSMTNTSTLDTDATLRQVIALYEAGCEMVRITAPTLKETGNLAVIRTKLENRGYNIPLVADIHFNPSVAETAAAIVHKIRINPGNYLDKQYFLSRTEKKKDKKFNPEVMREAVIRLSDICRKNGTVIRLGVNHGSLSERILLEYGNTAEGMVASAMEFLKICQSIGFNDLVVSMKSSHVPTMVKATLNTVQAMISHDMDYPVHLGVTEAGEGEDGRIRSAAGIGPLLAMGIGDTIRVSLTEDPVAEIPVAKKIAGFYNEIRNGARPLPMTDYEHEYHFKETNKRGIIGGRNPIAVIGNKPDANDELPADLSYSMQDTLIDKDGVRYHSHEFSGKDELESYLSAKAEIVQDEIFVFSAKNVHEIHGMFSMLGKAKIRNPVVIKLRYSDHDQFILKAAADCASLILNRYGNGFCLIDTSGKLYSTLTFGILQATSARISGTEYISCPTCGRTSFDIQTVLKEVKEHTRGYKNLKIAVMGCIVNGPGEMADADYGYVGAGKGKVSLYHAGKVVLKNIPEEKALEKLLGLIRETLPPE